MENIYHSKFRHKGMKMTPQRYAILQYLEGNTSHPSAENIYLAVKRQFPMISFATVYKTLEMLKQRGDVLELTIDPDRKRYDPDTEQHHHLICTRCSHITDIKADYEVQVPDDEKGSYEITGNHIEFYGICPECKHKE